MAPRTPTSHGTTSLTSEVESVLGPTPASYAQPEVVVLRFRRHGRRLVPPVIVLMLLAVSAGFWVGSFDAVWANLLAGVGAIALALLLGVLPILFWLSHRTTVTTRRVILRSGLFARSRTDLSLGRVREVRLRRSLFQRTRGSGDIELLHGTEQLTLSDAPDSEAIADALQELMERNYEHSTRAQLRLANLTASLDGIEGRTDRATGGVAGGDLRSATTSHTRIW